MAIELYDHQIAVLDKLKTGSILCGGVGSGKSRTALAYFYIYVCGGQMCINGQGRTVLPKKKIPLYIITTARKRDSEDWEKEVEPFYTIKPIVDSWNNIAKYRDVKNAYFIFDEQRVVGYGAWSKSFIQIAKNNDWILLSATPGDVWLDYAPVFIANGFYKNMTDFKRQHVVYSRFTKYPKVEKYIYTEKLDRLRSSILVNMHFDRSTISHHIDDYVQYDKRLYNRVDKDRWNIFTKEPIQNAGELCGVLRRIVNLDWSRLRECMRIAYKNERVIIFYNFDYELESLIDYINNFEAFLKDLDFSYTQWNGHKHEAIPSTKRWIYLVQYTAGAEAWNCIETNTIIFYSQNYSYKIMEQASGRIDRLNTPYVDLYYYHLISSSSIDKSIRIALNNKKKFNEQAYLNGEYVLDQFV